MLFQKFEAESWAWAWRIWSRWILHFISDPNMNVSTVARPSYRCHLHCCSSIEREINSVNGLRHVSSQQKLPGNAHWSVQGKHGNLFAQLSDLVCNYYSHGFPSNLSFDRNPNLDYGLKSVKSTMTAGYYGHGCHTEPMLTLHTIMYGTYLVVFILEKMAKTGSSILINYNQKIGRAHV